MQRNEAGIWPGVTTQREETQLKGADTHPRAFAFRFFLPLLPSKPQDILT